MHFFYLHGFASSRQSKKAAYLEERFRGHGCALHCPDFNEPDFFTLTITRMLDQLAAAIAPLDASQTVVLIGSSLGAVVAIHAATRVDLRISRLVLLAPAVMFPKDADTVLGADKVARWRATGTLDVFHHSAGATKPLHYRFFEDALQYDALEAVVPQPTLIFQGTRDDTVDHRVVERYASTRANVELALLDDDHQLIASLPRIWDGMARFLELTEEHTEPPRR